MDGKGSGARRQGGDGESGGEGRGGLTYSRRGPDARSEYPRGGRRDGSGGSRAGSDFGN